MPTKPASGNKLTTALPIVAALVRRTRDQIAGYEQTLAPGESMLSNNKVTGCSLNFPIAATCAPSKVCAKTCYFARGKCTWPTALKKQYRLYNTVKADPVGAARRLEAELRRRRNKLTFLRWNGVTCPP